MSRRDLAATHADRHANRPVGADLFLQQRRIDAVLHGYEQTVSGEMGQNGMQRIGRVIGTDGDKAGVELAVDLVGIDDFDFDVERTVGYIDLQAVFADRADMFLVDVHERDVRARAR